MRRFGLWVLVGALAFGVGAQPALARSGKSKASKAAKAGKAKLVFLGSVTAISVDEDAATPDTLSVSVLKANRPGRKWHDAHPGDVVVTLGQRTRFGGEMRLGRTASDYRVGDGVRVLAQRSGDALVARSVRLVLHAFEGSVESFDGAARVVGVRWAKANRVGRAWVGANGSPEVLTAAIVAASTVRPDGAVPQQGDHVALKARPAGADASMLEVVKMALAA